MKKRFLYFLCLLLSVLSSAAQNETKKWYFGGNAGLDFMLSPPATLTNSSMNSVGSAASIADANGNLLFYTNGSTIWDQTHAIMANGTGLFGSSGNFEPTALIVKQPGNASLYYIFTAQSNGFPSFGYSIVDMSLASGNGSVTVKNVTLTLSASGKMAATKHCNGTDLWVSSTDFGNAGTVFRTYLLTSLGITTPPVVSSFSTVACIYGTMKISPNGKKIGAANSNSPYSTDNFQLYDFDNSTGVVSNYKPLWLSGGVGYNGGFSCEFSPDGTKFYGTRAFGLHQWDLCAGSDSAIALSMNVVGSSTAALRCLQVAADGKVYVARYNQQTLGVIANPNLAGSSCNYVDLGQSVAPKTCYYALPTFVNYYALQPPPMPPFTYTAGAALGCQTASFTSPAAPNPTLSSCGGYSLVSLLWNFGDPASGLTNTSNLTNPGHFFTAPGTYTTQLILYYGCGGGTDTLSQQIVINQACISVHSTSITCGSLGSATVSSIGGGPYTYTWLPGLQTTSIVAGLIPGIYTVNILNTANNSTFAVSSIFNPQIPLTGNLVNSSSVSCNGAATGTAAVINLTGGSGSQNYLWSNGVNTYTAAAPATLSAGFWSVTVTDALTACTINQLFFINQPPAVILTLSSGSPTACVNTTIALTATASGGSPFNGGSGYTYSWTAGPAADSYTVAEAAGGSYTYTLTAKDQYSCSATNTVGVIFISAPVLSIADKSICPLQTGTLTASGATSYTWNTGATGTTFTDSPAAGQQYTITGSALGCTATANASITVMNVQLPALAFNSAVCEGDALMISASGGTAYSWAGPNSFYSSASGSTIYPVHLAANGIYNVTVTAANSCTAPASATITVNPLPVLTISPNSPSICANTTSILLTSAGTATLLSWQPNQAVSSNTSATITAFPAATQIYTLTGSLNNCTAVATATVNVVQPPSPNVSLSSATTCAELFNGSPNTITLTSSGANTYTIITPNDIYNSNPSGPITNLNTLPPHIPGVSTATLYGSNGVCTLSTAVAFTIIPNPTITINSYTPVICAGQTFTYTNAGADSYTWSSSTPGQTLYTTGSIAVADPTTSAVFSVFGGSLGCNSPEQTTTITVNPLPTLLLMPLPAATCSNTPLVLTASGTGTAYAWQPPYFLDSDQGATVSANPPAQQSYTVISSLNSCTASAVITVSVLPLPDLTITGSSQNVLCLNQTFTLQGHGGSDYTWEFPNHLTASGLAVQIIPANVSYSGNYTLTAHGNTGCSNTATIGMSIENNPGGYLQSNDLAGCVPLCGDYQFIASNFPQSEITVTGWQINNENIAGQSSFHHCFTSPGDYLVTGSLISTHGCADTISLTITAYPQPQASFSYQPEKPVENFDVVNFAPHRDQTITGFSWYFINNDPQNQSVNTDPAYLFEKAGAYPVALIVKNQWECRDSVVKVVTVESDFAVYVPNAFTPNADNRNELFYPVTRGVQLLSFMVFDRWGEKVFSTNVPGTGWDGTYRDQPCKEDVYVWKLEATSSSHENKKLNGFVTLYR